MPKAVIIDYGFGNIFGTKCSLEKAGFNVAISLSKQGFKDADAAVLPSVGNFRVGAEKPTEGKKANVLGICLGMQLLFKRSCENFRTGLSI
jgi:imidazoleglycerol phosphate synthase glutamine amidotransferase subunit HisH